MSGHQTAYDAAVLAFASMALRNLLAVEAQGDEEVQALTATVNPDGSIDVHLLSASMHPIGGHSL